MNYRTNEQGKRYLAIGTENSEADKKAQRESLLAEITKPKEKVSISQLELFSSIDNRKNWILFPRHKIAILRNDYWFGAVSSELIRQKDWLTNERALKVSIATDDEVKSWGYTLVYPVNSAAIWCKPHVKQCTYTGLQPIKIIDI